MTAVDLKVSCLGLYCPIPIMRAADAMKTLSVGQVLELVGDDPGILEDLPAWCRSTHHELLALSSEGERITGLIRKRGRTS